MANYIKPAIVIGLLIAAGGIAAVAAPVFNHKDNGAAEQKVFGISDQDLVFPYMRQPAWKQVSPGRFAVSPSRPESGFSDYAVSFDKATNRICAVYATAKDLSALHNLQASASRQAVITPRADAHEVKWVLSENCG